MTLLTLSTVFGLLFGIVLAYLILDDLSSGNWRLLVICSCVPSIIGCVKKKRKQKKIYYYYYY